MTYRKTSMLWALAALCLAFAPGCAEKPAPEKTEAPSEAKAEAFKRMSVDEVATRIADAKAGKAPIYVFDNNGKERFAKGHVPGAKWVAPDEIQAGDLPADKEATLVFYCGSEQCTACHDGALAAIKLGYKNVFIMPAGIKGWEAAQKELEVS